MSHQWDLCSSDADLIKHIAGKMIKDASSTAVLTAQFPLDMSTSMQEIVRKIQQIATPTHIEIRISKSGNTIIIGVFNLLKCSPDELPADLRDAYFENVEQPHLLGNSREEINARYMIEFLKRKFEESLFVDAHGLRLLQRISCHESNIELVSSPLTLEFNRDTFVELTGDIRAALIRGLYDTLCDHFDAIVRAGVFKSVPPHYSHTSNDIRAGIACGKVGIEVRSMTW